MGGYGAMNLALGNPRRFAVVESWLGFFNGLGGELKAAQPVIAREGLHAFVYGGDSDVIANPGRTRRSRAAARRRRERTQRHLRRRPHDGNAA